MAFFVIIPPGMEPINGNAMNPAALRRSDIFSDFLWSHDVRTQCRNFEICVRFWACLIANGSWTWVILTTLNFWHLILTTLFWFYWRATCVCGLGQKKLREHEKIIPSRKLFTFTIILFYFQERDEKKEKKSKICLRQIRNRFLHHTVQLFTA